MSQITGCRACGSADLFRFLDMGEQPLADAFLKHEDLDRPERTYPLAVVVCQDCTLIQITESVDPEIMFREYPYFSSVSETMVRHAKGIADRLRSERRLGPDSLVVELASNDGYLLRNFVEYGVPVLGIEPATNVAAHATGRGVRTLNEFFGLDLARRLAGDGFKADVVIANNVMAHIPDINGVVAGIKLLLNPNGVFVMETPYAKDMIDDLEFDTMHHEHFFCHSLTALESVFQRHGLAAIDVERVQIHGGTVRVTVTHAGTEGGRPRVRGMLEEERSWAAVPAYYADFGRRVDDLKRDLLDLLSRLKKDGKRTVGYGAAAKGSTLLNYMGIGPDLLDYVVDRSSYKQGKYMPGNHLPIREPERIVADRPDHLLLLAWNFADEIMAQQDAYRRAGGHFILPLPAVRVV